MKVKKIDCNNFIHLAKKIIQAIIGLAIFSLGSSFTICANIGLATWVALSKGICNITNLSYSLTHSAISLFILILDIILKEKNWNWDYFRCFNCWLNNRNSY